MTLPKPAHFAERARVTGSMPAAWTVMQELVWELIPNIDKVEGTGFALSDTQTSEGTLG
jgi:hypothetical protein